MNKRHNLVKAVVMEAEKTYKKPLLYILFLLPLFFIPAIIHSQWITGPIVNALLLIASALLGPLYAVTLGVLPGAVALAFGLLPPPLAPALPFVFIGNAVYVFVFHYTRRYGFSPAIILSSLAKGSLLFAGTHVILIKIWGLPLPESMAFMMSWPQFATALAGGFLALAALKALKK